MFLTNLLILKLQSYKNNSKPQIKALKIAFESLHFAKVLIARRATTFAKVLIARRATTFAKVLIACRATTFGKVDYFDSQSLLECVM